VESWLVRLVLGFVVEPADWADSNIVAQACHAVGGGKGMLAVAELPLFWLYAVRPVAEMPNCSGDGKAAATRSSGVAGSP